MEFKALKNIESSFRQIRLYAIIFLGCCMLLTVLVVWRSYSFAEAQRQKIYVLDQGRSLMLALSQDLQQNRPVEAREHVRRFHLIRVIREITADAVNLDFLDDISGYQPIEIALLH